MYERLHEVILRVHFCMAAGLSQMERSTEQTTAESPRRVGLTRRSCSSSWPSGGGGSCCSARWERSTSVSAFAFLTVNGCVRGYRADNYQRQTP